MSQFTKKKYLGMGRVFCTFLFYLGLIWAGWSLSRSFTHLDSCPPAGNASSGTLSGPCTTGGYTSPPFLTPSLLPAVGMQGWTWPTRGLCFAFGVTGFLLVLGLNVGYDCLH